jgi:hypothetical protein
VRFTFDPQSLRLGPWISAVALGLLLRNEYLAAENESLLSKLSDRPELTDSERIRLVELGKRLGLKALKDVAGIVKPETILAWYRKLVAEKLDGPPGPYSM